MARLIPIPTVARAPRGWKTKQSTHGSAFGVRSGWVEAQESEDALRLPPSAPNDEVAATTKSQGAVLRRSAARCHEDLFIEDGRAACIQVTRSEHRYHATVVCTNDAQNTVQVPTTRMRQQCVKLREPLAFMGLLRVRCGRCFSPWILRGTVCAFGRRGPTLLGTICDTKMGLEHRIGIINAGHSPMRGLLVFLGRLTQAVGMEKTCVRPESVTYLFDSGVLGDPQDDGSLSNVHAPPAATQNRDAEPDSTDQMQSLLADRTQAPSEPGGYSEHERQSSAVALRLNGQFLRVVRHGQ